MPGTPALVDGVPTPDPPPVTLLVDGVVYYLSHFNAYRAVYSELLPPAEPGRDELPGGTPTSS